MAENGNTQVKYKYVKTVLKYSALVNFWSDNPDTATAVTSINNKFKNHIIIVDYTKLWLHVISVGLQKYLPV